MMTRILSVVTASLWLSGCATSARVPDPPSGVVASEGGIAGYQHGVDRSLYSVGAHAHRKSEHGYTKVLGDEGTLAIDQVNGSTYGVPTATAQVQKRGPYGKTPADHDAFVRAYFVKCGIPVEQIGASQGRTLIEVTGRSDEQERTVPKVTGYYTVLQRVVEGIPVMDSFAWARVNVAGDIVEEAVYWPAISADVVGSLHRLREATSDRKLQHELAERVAAKSSSARLAIHHSAASSHDLFEAFASVDVLINASSPEAKPWVANDLPLNMPAPSGTSYVRHFDIEGHEMFLPQERFHLEQKFPGRRAATNQPDIAAAARSEKN